MTTTMKDRARLEALEAEQCIIATVLAQPGPSMPVVAPILAADDFMSEDYRTLFTAMRSLFDEQVPITMVALQNWLERNEGWGQDRLLTIAYQTEHQTMFAEALKRPAEIIHERAMQRGLLRLAESIRMRADDPSCDPVTLTAQIEDEILGLDRRRDDRGGLRSIGDIGRDVYQQYEDELARGEVHGIKTGWRSLNRILRPLLPGSSSSSPPVPAWVKALWR